MEIICMGQKLFHKENCLEKWRRLMICTHTSYKPTSIKVVLLPKASSENHLQFAPAQDYVQQNRGITIFA